MGNQFLKGLQRPAIMPEGSSLPDYSEANDGDALIIEDGEPVWGAVSGLPDFTAEDEGKVLTVVAQMEDVAFVPEQSVTLAPLPAQQGINYAILSNVVAPTGTPSEGDKATLTIGERTLELLYYMDGYYNQEEDWGIVYDGSEDGFGWFIRVYGESGTVTVSATREDAGDLEAEWAKAQSGIHMIVDDNGTLNATYEDIAAMARTSPVFIRTNDGHYWDLVMYLEEEMEETITYVVSTAGQLTYTTGSVTEYPTRQT